MGAKGLCIPFTQPADVKDTDKCIGPECTKKPICYTLFGRSYQKTFHGDVVCQISLFQQCNSVVCCIFDEHLLFRFTVVGKRMFCMLVVEILAKMSVYLMFICYSTRQDPIMVIV